MRFWVCWYCADAESIISEWKDMYDKWDAKSPMEKLKLLMKKWRKYDRLRD